jgi:hypothetical protein
LRAANACTARGEVEALLRREGVYNSHLAAKRKAPDLHGLREQTRGRKPVRDERDARTMQVEREKACFEKEISTAKQLVALQESCEPAEPRPVAERRATSAAVLVVRDTVPVARACAALGLAKAPSDKLPRCGERPINHS